MTLSAPAALATMVLLAGAAMAPAAATARRIVVTDTIQAALNTARPGDTVVVPAGVYRESVTIPTSGITLTGGRDAIIDAAGAASAVSASSGRISRPPGQPASCPPATLTDIAVRGLTIRNAGFTGVLLRGVDGFEVSGGSYVNNGQYGVFPVCAHNGVVDGNQVEGSQDAGLYIGNSDTVDVTGNQVRTSTIGVEVENSDAVTVAGNQLRGNTAGVAAFVLPNLPNTTTAGLRVTDNVVTFNNRPNPLTPDPAEPVSLIPTGTGIVAVGADDTLIGSNNVVGNDSGGIAVLANPLAAADPRLDPAPDRDRVVGNVTRRNGLNPDTVRSPVPGADLIYDGTGTGTCFAGNVFGTQFPADLSAVFACPT